MTTGDQWTLVGFYVLLAIVWVLGVAMHVATLQHEGHTEKGRRFSRLVFLTPVWPLALVLLVIKPLAKGIWFMLELIWAVLMVAIGRWETLDGPDDV